MPRGRHLQQALSLPNTFQTVGNNQSVSGIEIILNFLNSTIYEDEDEALPLIYPWHIGELNSHIIVLLHLRQYIKKSYANRNAIYPFHGSSPSDNIISLTDSH